MEIHSYLDPRHIGSNFEPWELVLVDDDTGDPLDLTGYTGTFTYQRLDGGVGGFSGALSTLANDGRCVYPATKAQVDALTAGEYRAQWVVVDGAGQVVRKSFVYGQHIRANV